jgi:subtilisin family serine protease
MRFFLTLLCALTFLHLQAQNIDEAFVSEELLDRLEDMPGQAQDIYVFLADRVDVDALLAKFQNERTPLDVRATTVITLLQDKAASTQGPLLELMEGHPGLVSGSLQPLWITNVIQATATSDLIAELSRQDLVEWIDWVAPPEPTETIDHGPAPMSFSPGGTEPGLDAINVAPLWEMGYSGYGTISFIMDTGMDPYHPALYTHYRGIYGSHQESYFNGSNEEPDDCDGHGTHVTGTVLGLDRVTSDTIGVAINSQWIGANNIGCGDGPGTLAAFQWALNPDNNVSTTDDIPAVVNNSWYNGGGVECNGAFASIFTALEAAGVAVVFAAGNFGPGVGTVTAPSYINTDLVNTFAVGNLNANSASLTINNGSSRGPSPCGGMGSILIKPEVSAPGTLVRSSVPGGYSNFTGTSMASPHVAGAVSILREAFPDASGIDIKLALYFTAIDLGDPGEDNVYGMGIINVEAAFNYLIDEGFTPADPIVANDLLLYDLKGSAIYCTGADLAPTIRVENGGTDLIESFTVEYWIDGGDAFEYTWTGALEAGERLTLDLPGQPIAAQGDWVYAEVVSVNGQADDRSLNNKLRIPVETLDQNGLEPYVLETETGTFCEGSPVFLRAEGYGPGTPEFSWYDVETGGTPLAIGDVFETPPVTEDATYYVDASYLVTLGMESTNPGESDVWDSGEEYGLMFDAEVPFEIRSVMVNAPTTGPRIIELRNNQGSLVSTKFVQITETGWQRVDLNINVPVGQNHRLIMGAGAPFTHSISGFDFPFTIEGFLEIDRAYTPFGGTTQVYNYFYDFELAIEEQCPRTAYDVSPGAAGTPPEANFSLPTATVEVGEV